MYRPLFIALVLSAVLSTTPAAAVSLSGACEALANTGAQSARQRDAGVPLRDSLADVADYYKPDKLDNARSRAIATTWRDRYTAAVRVAYSSSRLTPEEIFDYVNWQCMKNCSVKRGECVPASQAPQVAPVATTQTTPVAADIARMQAEIDAKMRKLQDDNAAQWTNAQAETLRQQQAEATRQRVETAKREAEDKAKAARLDAEWAARDTNAAAQRAIQAEVPVKPTVWEILSTPSHPRYSTSCYTSSYGGKRYRSTYTRCY